MHTVVVLIRGLSFKHDTTLKMAFGAKHNCMLHLYLLKQGFKGQTCDCWTDMLTICEPTCRRHAPKPCQRGYRHCWTKMSWYYMCHVNVISQISCNAVQCSWTKLLKYYMLCQKTMVCTAYTCWQSYFCTYINELCEQGLCIMCQMPFSKRQSLIATTSDSASAVVSTFAIEPLPICMQKKHPGSIVH